MLWLAKMAVYIWNWDSSWQEFMRDVGKIKLTMNPQKKTLDSMWDWLLVSVSPSLELFAEVGKLDNQDYIALLIENGKMNDTQRKIYDDYKKISQLEEEERRLFGR